MTRSLAGRVHWCLVALATTAILIVAFAGCDGGDDDGGGDGNRSQSARQSNGGSSGGGGDATDGGGDLADWPYFGRVTQRTHTLGRGPEPPLHYLWQFFARQLLEFPPALADGTLYAVNKSGGVYAVRTSDGKVRWRRQLHPDVTGPAYASGSLYLAELNGSLSALDADTGKTRWSVGLGSRLESSPLVVGDTVYLGTDAGDLMALEASNGHVRWKRNLGAPVKASPSYHNGVLYVGDYEGTIHALPANGGKPRWSVDTTSLPPGGDGGFYSSPAIAFGRLYEGRDDGAFYALTLDGKPAWHLKTGGPIYGSPALTSVDRLGAVAFIGSYDRKLYALDATSGKPHWTHNVGGQVPGSPTVVGDTVYTSSFITKKTTGLRTSTGKPVFTWGSAGYEPMISDGERIYLSGFQTIWAFEAK